MHFRTREIKVLKKKKLFVSLQGALLSARVSFLMLPLEVAKVKQFQVLHIWALWEQTQLVSRDILANNSVPVSIVSHRIPQVARFKDLTKRTMSLWLSVRGCPVTQLLEIASIAEVFFSSGFQPALQYMKCSLLVYAYYWHISLRYLP